MGISNQMKKVLGIDLGDARVGLAISDDLGMLAHPHSTLTVAQGQLTERIAALVRERGVDTVVVGMPRNMDGSHGPAAEKTRVFVEALRKLIDVPVLTWDERLTTVSAQRALQEAGRKAKDQKSVVDQVAAQIILQGWLDAHAA
jgi:putative Holliday junction resolvase